MKITKLMEKIRDTHTDKNEFIFLAGELEESMSLKYLYCNIQIQSNQQNMNDLLYIIEKTIKIKCNHKRPQIAKVALRVK